MSIIRLVRISLLFIVIVISVIGIISVVTTTSIDEHITIYPWKKVSKDIYLPEGGIIRLMIFPADKLSEIKIFRELEVVYDNISPKKSELINFQAKRVRVIRCPSRITALRRLTFILMGR